MKSRMFIFVRAVSLVIDHGTQFTNGTSGRTYAMRFFRLACVFVLIGLAPATPVSAEQMTGNAAKKLLFAPVKAEVEILPEAGLAQDMADALVVVGEGQPYYGAVAIAPDEGLMSEATVAAANFHGTRAAGAAALAQCNAKKKSATDCVLAAYIRPRGWADVGFGLSSDATAAFKDFDMKTGAFAVSNKTGAFGMAAGQGADEAALANCVAKNNKATDCTLVIGMHKTPSSQAKKPRTQGDSKAKE